MTDPLSLIGKDWQPDGVISKWLRHGYTSREGVTRGLYLPHGSFRLDLTLRKRVIAAKRLPAPTLWQRLRMWWHSRQNRPRRRFGLTREYVWLGVKNYVLEAAMALGLVRPIPFTWDD